MCARARARVLPVTVAVPFVGVVGPSVDGCIAPHKAILPDSVLNCTVVRRVHVSVVLIERI